MFFVGMNPLKDGASSRTKDSLKGIRHVYLDLDEGRHKPRYWISVTHLTRQRRISS